MSNLQLIADQLKENNTQNMEGHLLTAFELEKLNSKMKSFLDMLKNQQMDMLELMREKKEQTEKAGQAPDAGKESGGYGKIIAGIAALAGGILAGISDSLKMYAKMFKLPQLMDLIKVNLSALKTTILTSLDDLLKPVKNFFSSKAGKAAGGLAAIIDDFKVRSFVVFDDAIKAIDNMLQPVKNLFTAEGRIAKLFNMIKAPFVFPFEGLIGDATKGVRMIFESIDGPSFVQRIVNAIRAPFDFVMNAAAKAGDFIRGAFAIFDEGSALMKGLSSIGRIIGRLFFPITLIMTAWDTVKGAISGFEDEGIIGAIQGAITGLINSIIGAPLDLLKDIMAWTLSKFGFDESAEALKGFSVQDFFSRAIDSVFDMFKMVINGIIELAASAIESIPLIGSGVGDKIRSFKFDTNVQERKALDKEIEGAKASDAQAKRDERSALRKEKMIESGADVYVNGKLLTGAEREAYLDAQRNKTDRAIMKSDETGARLEELKAQRAALDGDKRGVNVINAPSVSNSNSNTQPLITTTPSASDYGDPMLAGA